MAFLTCHVDNKVIAEEFANYHHVTPRAAGGSNDNANLKALCPSCHMTAHRVAEMMKRNQTAQAESLLLQMFPNPPIRARLWELAKIVYEEMLKASESSEGPEDGHVVAVEFTHPEFERLQVLAADRRQGGRKVGISKVIHSVVTQYLKTRGLL